MISRNRRRRTESASGPSLRAITLRSTWASRSGRQYSAGEAASPLAARTAWASPARSAIRLCMCASSESMRCRISARSSSAIPFLKVLHKRDQSVYRVTGLGIVQAGAQAASRTMALEPDQPVLFRFGQKPGGQPLIGRPERNIHYRATLRRHGVVPKAGRVYGGIKPGRPFLVALANCLEAALVFHPAQRSEERRVGGECS